MSVMVLGAGGCIGRAVCTELKQSDVAVWDVYHSAAPQGGLTVDATDGTAVMELLSDIGAEPDAVINCAGSVSPDRELPQFADMSTNVLHAIAGLGLCSRLVVVGSAGVYGRPSRLPVAETFPASPNTAYTEAKYMEELQVASLAGKLGVGAVIARCFNIIGPGLPDRLMLMQALRAIEDHENSDRHDRRLTLPVRDLLGTRDYVAVTDAARGLVTLARTRELEYDIYNVGSGTEMTNEALLRILLDAKGYHDVTVNEVVLQANGTTPHGLTYASQADIRRLSELGWRPGGHDGVEAAIKAIIADRAP